MAENGTDNPLSDGEVRLLLKDILKDIDVASTSIREIRNQLQAKVGFRFNVEERKDFLKETIANLLMEGEEDNQEDAAMDEDESNILHTTDGTQEETSSEKKKKGGGFSKPLVLSDELAEFMGRKIASRTDVTKRIWEYIKGNNLQNPANRREILCDTSLEKLMKRKKINMFKMTQILNPMMKRAQDLQASCLSDSEDDDQSAAKTGAKRKASAVTVKKETNNKKKSKQSNRAASESDSGSDSEQPARKRAKATAKPSSSSSSGSKGKVVSDPINNLNKSIKVKKQTVKEEDNNTSSSVSSATTTAAAAGSGIYVHPELLAALNVTEVATRPQLVKKMWEYIRSNNLQNPADKREIILDEAFKRVFKVNKFTAFSMNRYLNNVVKKQ